MAWWDPLSSLSSATLTGRVSHGRDGGRDPPEENKHFPFGILALETFPLPGLTLFLALKESMGKYIYPVHFKLLVADLFRYEACILM
jgi:hypothetical protein